MSAHVEDRLSPYLDGELSAGERDRVESHLRGCPACARHLEELRAVDAAARALPLEAPAGYFGTFSGRLRERLPQRRARRWPAWALAAAAGLALAVLVPLSARRVVSPVPEAVKTDALRSSTPTSFWHASTSGCRSSPHALATPRKGSERCARRSSGATTCSSRRSSSSSGASRCSGEASRSRRPRSWAAPTSAFSSCSCSRVSFGVGVHALAYSTRSANTHASVSKSRRRLRR